VRGRKGNEERINDTEEISVAFWELLELFSGTLKRISSDVGNVIAFGV
jgi:hypothetical protein